MKAQVYLTPLTSLKWSVLCCAYFNTHTHTHNTNPGSLADRENVKIAFASRPPVLKASGAQGSRSESSVTHRLKHRLGQKTGCDFADVTLTSHFTKDVAIQVSGLERNPSYHKGLHADKAKVVLLRARIEIFLPNYIAVALAW